MELLISQILKIGVRLSLAIILIGMVLSFVHHPDYLWQKDGLARLTRPPISFPHSVAATAQGLAKFRGQSVVVVGLLLLIATPVVRVGVSVFGFAYERDRTYVVITTIVLVFLIASFFLGKAVG